MSRLRVGMVGAGGVAHAHLPAWIELGADVGVFALDGARDLTARHGGRVVESLADLIEGSDVIDVCTPTRLHRAHAEQALRAGRDVVCEKPLTRTTEDAVALAELAAETGRRLFPAHVVRFYPEYAAMARAVEQGRIGELAVLRFTRTSALPRMAWYAETSQSGGVVMDLMIHDIDLARWVAGDVTEVYATYNEDRSNGALVATANVVLTHASGAISHVRGVWGPRHLSFRTGFHVAGSTGTLSYDSASRDVLRLDAGDGGAGDQFIPASSFTESPYLTELREFAAACSGGPSPRVDTADGVIAVQLVVAALESIDTGQSVTLPAPARVA